jgi:hypothetical protein
MLDPLALQKLYTSYGFETVESQYADISIFVYKKSRYFGVDIIPIGIGSKLTETAISIKESYSKTGYAANVKNIQNIDEAELELFKSFFAFDASIQRVQRKYQDFTNKQKISLIGYPYKYIDSPFELHNHTPNQEDKRIFDTIEQRLQSDRPELIIVEAAAGYGKTCTAFEVLHKVVERQSNQLPIFTELSRNRGANIFRYILLDEIDLEFPSLSSQLVIKEIKNGRIPLIIDGFDELLEKVNAEQLTDNSFEEVESMLDTIGTLLEHKAKIILTTRRTAIFTGLEFEKWLQKWTDSFQLTRIALKDPRIKDWIGTDRYQLVKDKNVPIQNLANPVLLTFLKNLPTEEFDQLIEHPDLLIGEYFDKMLTREKDRQELLMTVENQLHLFRNVAKQLLDLDSTAEDKEFFKMIILEDNKKLLEDTRLLYTSASKRTVENLVDTLSTHALLDRKGRDQNQIGFINDFVFGTFIGEILIEMTEGIGDRKYSTYMIELAVTAFRVQNLSTKERLWDKIQPVNDRFLNEQVFLFDIHLKECIVRKYKDMTINDESFFTIVFDTNEIASSIFLNCFFKNCTFDANIFKNVSFVSCLFSNCKVKDQGFLDKDNFITTIKCRQENCNILHQPDVPVYIQEIELVNELEKSILKQLWGISHTKGHHLVKLYDCFKSTNRRKLNQSLKHLEELGYLEIRGIHVYFQINQITQIKQILST